MQDKRSGKGDFVGKFPDNLRGSYDGALFGCQGCECLRELRFAVMLTGVRCGHELLCCGEFGVELIAIAAVGAPCFDERDTKNHSNEDCCEFEPDS